MAKERKRKGALNFQDIPAIINNKRQSNSKRKEKKRKGTHTFEE
jgi:hypothetical protein